MTIQDVLDFVALNDGNLEHMRRIRLACDKNIKSINSNATDKSLSKNVANEALEIAMALRTMVLENYPHLERSTDAKKWATDIDKIHRLDKYDWKIIEGVMKWSQDDDFWSQQIRSGGNLRKHFDTMLVRIKSEPKAVEFIS